MQRGRPFRDNAVLLGFLAAGLLWRLVLALRFFGWEEDDYSNLARSYAVAFEGFGELSVSHLPLYYLVNAALIRVVGHADVVCKGTSLLCGLAAMARAMLLARRAGGRLAEIFCGAILLVQPEFALYASSSLREPMYAALGLAGVWWIIQRRPLLAALAMIGALLVRAEAFATFWPGYLLLIGARGRGTRRRFFAGLGLMAVTLILVSWWAKVGSGSWLLFAPQLQANLDTGGVAEARPLGEFLTRGARVSTGLALLVLPGKVGWPLVLLAGWGAIQVARKQIWNRTAVVVALFFVLNLGVWLGLGFVIQHAITHNLYWKWLYATVPLLALTAAFGLADVAERLGGWRRWQAWGTIGATLAWFLVCAGVETVEQIRRADELFLPQLRLAREIERTVPPGTALIVDHIPASYLSRRAHGYELVSWFDLAEEYGDGSPDGFDDALAVHDVRWVMWFEEGWTMAPAVAPFLGGDERVVLRDHVLEVQKREDRYGWVWYRVDRR